MKAKFLILVGVFFLCSLLSFGSTFEKEFSFELSAGETDRSWEINIPFPGNETGKFIGRDFKPVVENSSVSFFVEKESLTDSNYHAKIRMLSLASNSPQVGKLQVTLEIGSNPLNDIPSRPVMIGWTLGPTSFLKWLGKGDEKGKLPVSARYLYYKVSQDESLTLVLGEKVVPVWVEGLIFPFNHGLQASQTYFLTVQFSNSSGKYSPPTVLKMGPKAKPLSY